MSNILDTFPVLETEKLILRKLKHTDANDLYTYYSNPHVTRYLNWNGPGSVEAAAETIQSWNNQFEEKNFIRWAVTSKGEDKLIGTVMIITKDRSKVYGLFHHKIADVTVIGYELAEEYWNQGIMSEALSEVIRFIFTNFSTPRIQAYVEPENGASKHILENLGFKKEGFLKSYLFDTKEMIYDDVIMMALLRTEYPAAHTKE